MKKIFFISMPLLFLYVNAFAQDDEEAYTVASCSLAVKTTVYPASAEDRSGRVMIEAFLCDKVGSPIANQEIQMTASSGTFSCIPPESFSSPEDNASDRSCFVTAPDGKIRVYLTSVPFNTQGKLKASASYNGCSVRATSTFSINRNVIKKRSMKK
jgi:hypothetical protein